LSGVVSCTQASRRIWQVAAEGAAGVRTPGSSGSSQRVGGAPLDSCEAVAAAMALGNDGAAVDWRAAFPSHVAAAAALGACSAAAALAQAEAGLAKLHDELCFVRGGRQAPVLEACRHPSLRQALVRQRSLVNSVPTKPAPLPVRKIGGGLKRADLIYDSKPNTVGGVLRAERSSVDAGARLQSILRCRRGLLWGLLTCCGVRIGVSTQVRRCRIATVVVNGQLRGSSRAEGGPPLGLPLCGDYLTGERFCAQVELVGGLPGGWVREGQGSSVQFGRGLRLEFRGRFQNGKRHVP
jgi:hypothetical protein